MVGRVVATSDHLRSNTGFQPVIVPSDYRLEACATICGRSEITRYLCLMGECGSLYNAAHLRRLCKYLNDSVLNIMSLNCISARARIEATLLCICDTRISNKTIWEICDIPLRITKRLAFSDAP